MGREIRRVPPNWKHPLREFKRHDRDFQPMYDENFKDACIEWHTAYMEWVSKHPTGVDEDNNYFWECEGTPPDDEKYYHDFSKEDATWYQAYETVSEGTPVTPPFETQQELINYLAEYGDFWYQQDMQEGRETFRSKPTLEQATRFVMGGFIPTGIVENGVVKFGYEQL